MTTDPEGDNIAYQFDWGTENNSSWSDFLNSGDSITIAHPWNDTGHYNIRVRAMDIKEKISRWSDPHFLDIVISIAPNIPSIFSGPNNGYVNYSYTFSTTTTDPDGDSISYQFDWGNDSLSPWSSYVPSGDSVQMNYSWSLVGTYNIRLKAKDKYGLESGWSPEHSTTISIAPNLPPEVPDTPSGPSNGYVASIYMFTTATTDPNEDSISYQFDWGDTNLSAWSNYVSSGQSVSLNHSYSSPGIYSVTAKAKDVDGAESDWSDGHQITISNIPNNPPNTPPAPSGPSNGYEDSTYNFSAVANDPDEDSISYQFDWGDSIYSVWSDYVSNGQSISMTHSYSSEGIYLVRTRAKDKDGAESGWSGEHQILISVTPNSPPNIPTIPSWLLLGHKDSTYNFYATTIDPDGDSISFQFDWGDSTLSEWSPYISSGDTISMTYSYSSIGTYRIRVKAKDKNEVESDWSNRHPMTITRMKWSFSTGDYVVSSPAIASDGTIYVGSIDNNLYAINPNGSQKWTFSTGDQVGSTPSIGSDGTIYVGSYDNNLYAINPDGSQKWTFSTGDRILSSPAIGLDGTIYLGSWNGNLYAINPNGTKKWSYQTGNSVHSSPAISSDNIIYLGSGNDSLYAINPDGSKRWAFSTGDNIFSSPAIGSDGTIYVGSYDNNLYAINPNGSQKWAFSTGDNIFSSPVIGSDGIIYVGSFDNNLYAINPNGSQKWAFSTRDNVVSSAAIGSDGTIYVGSTDNNLYAINPDGTEKWKFSTQSFVESSPALGFDGTVYIGSDDHKLYAIDDYTSGLAYTPWPMFHHDLKHTGRAGEP
jgi:outer membrane protein assembly factor BamB